MSLLDMSVVVGAVVSHARVVLVESTVVLVESSVVPVAVLDGLSSVVTVGPVVVPVLSSVVDGLVGAVVVPVESSVVPVVIVVVGSVLAAATSAMCELLRPGLAKAKPAAPNTSTPERALMTTRRRRGLGCIGSS
jgi:hypothetical protein